MDRQERTIEDREVLLAWDAMGYNAGISYDKVTKRLLGYAEDFQFGLCVQRYANKVNVLTVISPQKHIKLSFPIAHYHVNTLTRFFDILFVICIMYNVININHVSAFIVCSTQIYEQVMDVVERLYHSSALKVVGLICDGASEHSKFFRIVLDGVSTTDPRCKIYMDHPCDEQTKVFAISDVPHITKKGRGSLLRSGRNPWSTRRMLFGKLNDTIHDGHLITWDPLIWIHEERNKKNAAGQQRRECDMYYLFINVFSVC